MEHPNACPFSGLPIVAREEWQNVRFGDDYIGSFYMIGDRMLHVSLRGNADEAEFIAMNDFKYALMAEQFNDEAIVEIRDYSGLRSIPSPVLRRLQVNYFIENHKRYISYIAYGASPFIRMVFKLGASLHPPQFPFLFVESYKKAMVIAQREIERTTAFPAAPVGAEVGRSLNNGNETVVLHREDIHRLVQQIARLSFEKNNIKLDKVPSDHPLFHVYDVLALVVQDTKRLITERDFAIRSAEENVRVANEANEAKSIFLATMSHEIRTPMNGILGMNRLLLDTHLSDEQREQADVVQQSASSLLALINDILDFSKIESGKLEIEHIPFRMEDAVTAVTRVVRPLIADKAIEFQLTIDANVPPLLKGDPGRIQQVLLNLISNAVKFTDKGAIRVEISCGLSEGNQALLRFTVEDSGIGISPKARAQIFSPFVQADGSTTRKFGGTGLGLAICHKLVAAMGGEIDFESSRHGTTFIFVLSMEIAGIREQASLLPQNPTSRATILRQHMLGGTVLIEEAQSDAPEAVPNILVVEDNRINQKVVLGMLKKMGIAADVVENGKLALDALRQKPFDLVLMDIQMPIMDGFAATKKIRDGEVEGLDPDIPIIALTANAMKGDKEKCILAGMNGYLSKPISPDDMANVVKKWRVTISP